MPPDLFNLCSYVILRELSSKDGIVIDGFNGVNNLRFADDTVLVLGWAEKLENQMPKTEAGSEQKSLKLNAKKKTSSSQRMVPPKMQGSLLPTATQSRKSMISSSRKYCPK